MFGRILPATGLMLFLSTLYYAWLAYRLAKKTGRNDVCALPVGHQRAPHVHRRLRHHAAHRDQDRRSDQGMGGGADLGVRPELRPDGWRLRGAVIRRITPRAALLGALAGVSIAFISLRPALDMYMSPLIGLVCFAILLASWFGGVRYYKGIPAGLVAIGVGSIIAWGSTALGFDFGGMTRGQPRQALLEFRVLFSDSSGRACVLGLRVSGRDPGHRDPVRHLRSGRSDGQRRKCRSRRRRFPTTRVLTADGVVSLIGCLMGNPFINAVYIGHPGWKAIGGRIGYSAATGVMVLMLSWFGILALLMALIPVVAISPILLYIGMLIGAQAFQETPRSHAPAIDPGTGAAGRGVGKAADRQCPRRGRHQCGGRRRSTSWGRSAWSTTAWKCSAAARFWSA